MVPGSRIVVYQGSPETIQLSLYEDCDNADEFEAGATVMFTARRQGSTTASFTIPCTFENNVLSIPFTATHLTLPGCYDYTVTETPNGGTPVVKINGTYIAGDGLEVVPVVG